ncbi:MAG TPA: neutral/alkaline non-lysosomal ceramidase N-terminal domain-containing protein, partial [Polyangiaceae bacterium]|nr:neutral/alkaline non-lysosomal ceramidase N-terminal domain-containing protein [Polyangiaceae bacterium]
MNVRAIALGIAATLAGCAHAHFPAVTASAPSFAPTPSSVEVGVSRAEITLPPGVSTFGHGPDARVTHGLWTRLYCRAFVFKQGDAALAIVPCDLPAMGMLLQRRVAQEVARAGVAIPAPRLMLSATHTHAGPAHYLDGAAYTGFGSTQLPAFDEAIVDRLAKSIAAAVVDAYHHARRAELRWARTEVLTLTRNRDIAAFVRNREPPWAANCPERSELCAIDPDLSVLELRDAATPASPCPLGALVFFAMHPTVLPNTNQLLGADAFGVASRALEERLRLAGKDATDCPRDPLAGIVNTNEGDVVSRFVSASVE